MSYYDTFVEQKDFCYFVHRKGWTTPAHFHGAVEILFAEKGKQRVTINGETRTLEEGEACFCEPFAVHSYIPEDENTSVFVFVIGKEYCGHFFEMHNGKILPNFFNFDNYPFLETLYELFSYAHNDTLNYRVSLRGIVGILFARIADQVTLVEKAETSKQVEIASQILQYVDRNYKENCSIEELSQKFNYSRGYLTTLLKKVIGEPWPDFVNRLRVRYAHNRLTKDANVSVDDVAIECGFNSMMTFYRAYKKVYQKTPRR